MRRNILVSVILLMLFNFQSLGQDTTKLLLNFEVADMPYSNGAWKLYGLGGYLSPSMSQSLKTAESTYNLAHYFYSRVNWDKLTKYWYVNLFAQISAYYAMELSLMYLPFGDAWLHEEFHRSILTSNNITSHDQVYDFPIFSQYISVNNVTDSALIAMKASSPSDFVRLAEAGIEGEYLLVEQLQKRSFFLNQTYSYWLSEVSITLNDIFYVFMCHTDMAITETDKFNEQETTVEQRDFTGLDFTAWVYDLFNPYAPYQERGIHPSGIGIDRYVKPNDLYPEAYNYLTLQGYLQFLNLLSPFLIGINRFKTKSGVEYNFAVRHYLTSFGFDINFQLFRKSLTNSVYSLHLFSSQKLLLPALEYELYRQKIDENTYVKFNFIIGLQPENLIFYDTKPAPLGYVNLRIDKYYKNFGIYGELAFKSQGWVPGEIYQTPAANFRIGLSFKK